MNVNSKKKITFAICFTSAMAMAVLGVLSESGNNPFAMFASGNENWVHYAAKAATSTANGVREYWVKCGGGYQFSAPTSGNITEGTAYDTSEFTTNDPRIVKWTGSTLFYDLSQTAFDYAEAGEYTDYVNTGLTPSTTLGSKATATFTKDDTTSSLQFDVLTVSEVIKTKDSFVAMLKANGAAQTAGTAAFTGYYVLGADIDCEGATFVQYNADAAKPYAVISNADRKWGGGFGATFDGRGHAVRNFDVNWDSRLSIFGDASGGGVIKNTLFELKGEWRGYGGILCDAVYNTVVKNNFIIIPTMKDNAANSAIAYDAVGTSDCIVGNVVYYKSSTNLTNAALICRDGRSDGKGGYKYNVGVTSTTTKLFNVTAYDGNNAKVAGLADLVTQGAVANYTYLNSFLSENGGHYYWGQALIA